MGIVTILLPDVGEGIAEAELTEWSVKVGDIVSEDDVLGVVMTDKVAVEVPSIARGTITWLAGEVGDFLSVGAPYVKLEILGEGNAEEAEITEPPEPSESVLSQKTADETLQNVVVNQNPAASPSVRKRAREANIDLHQVAGSGPGGRILLEDLQSHASGNSIVTTDATHVEGGAIEAIKIVGMRRAIATKMALANSTIPHITIVEEIDVEALEDLRAGLNKEHFGQREKLTIIPFMMRAIVKDIAEQPQMNAHFDDKTGTVYQHSNVHIGIATQTDEGLMVPVVKSVEALTTWQCAQELSRLATAARKGKATRDELSGATITISSLGLLGAIATTPIINPPEVAIVGINKIAIRPMWDGQQFQPRKMMNISCSFDHRIIDGWNAALFVQKLKSLLESPEALIKAG